MKTIVLILFILLSGCAVSRYPEGNLIKTKAYCGRSVSVSYHEKTSTIQTTMLVFTVKGHPDVPEGSSCYIRREICYQDVVESMKQKLEHKYFSWDNSKEYRIKGNIPYKLFSH